MSPRASTSAISGRVLNSLSLPHIIVPALSPLPVVRSQSSLTQLICDERATLKLLETLLERAGLSRKEAARRLGVDTAEIRHYLGGRRRPGLLWFLRFCELCGARVTIEFPARS